ncbi:MAG: hypothetical protein KC547_04870 [Anaerolineae bacterium]|nr:hypothetical protein [Anaerolineae bacterium]MCA9908427.1 hypothetical protein [Anaerolineae bacterium]
MSFLGGFVGFVLVAVAALTVFIVFYIVSREKHEHLEYYIPPQKPVEDPPAGASQD